MRYAAKKLASAPRKYAHFDDDVDKEQQNKGKSAVGDSGGSGDKRINTQSESEGDHFGDNDSEYTRDEFKREMIRRRN